MTDERSELRQINWGEVFAFTHIFKSFRMAIHPSKLLLALAAIVLIWGVGSVMDRVWSWGGQSVWDGQIMTHATQPASAYERMQERWDEKRFDRAARLRAQTENEKHMPKRFLALVADLNPGLAKAFKKKIDEKNKDRKEEDPKSTPENVMKQARGEKWGWSGVISRADAENDDKIERIEELREAAYSEAIHEIQSAKVGDEADAVFKTGAEQKKAVEALNEADARVPQILTLLKLDYAERSRQEVKGTRIFESLLLWERKCLSNALSAARSANFTGGLSRYRAMRKNRALPSQKDLPDRWKKEHRLAPELQAHITSAVDGHDPGAEPVPADNPGGVLYWGLMGLQGWMWLACEHWIYATIFLVLTLAIVSVFGGAVYRIAALQAAREEKISMGQAVKFSISKFFSFFSAPLLPIAIILLLGLLLAAGGALANIKWVGPIIMGALFFLALITGVIIAFLSIGLIGGAGLMYPTIAVEGSDSFDAISRSFSYIFSRPWHAILYGAVATVYGALTYLFVRLFGLVALSATHFFVKWFIGTGGEGLDPRADKLDAMWTRPTFDNLMGGMNCHAVTNSGQSIGGWLIWFWVAIVVGLVAAYLLSYFASSTTVIYYLLRRKIDATDLDDVNVEEEEEEMDLGAEVPATTEGPEDEEKPAEEDEPAEEPEPAEDKKPADEDEPVDKDKGDDKDEQDKTE